MTTVSFVLREGEETVSVEQNKIVAERFFEEVFNNKKTESVDELVAGDVVDHNRIIFAQPEGPGGVAEGIPAKEYRFEDYADRTLSASLRGHLERHRFFSGKDRGINQSGIQRYKGNAEEGAKQRRRSSGAPRSFTGQLRGSADRSWFAVSPWSGRRADRIKIRNRKEHQQ
jgi:hypothetical protein